MTAVLTEKQKETLQIIETHIATHGIPPTLSELQVLLDVSSNQAVLNHLDGLEEKGFIERKKTARGIRLLNNPQKDNEQEQDFLGLLTDIAEKKKQKKSTPKKVGYSDPYSMDESPNVILSGSFNNEQY
jgi:SOS-response transcriptional repressor LexA